MQRHDADAKQDARAKRLVRLQEEVGGRRGDRTPERPWGDFDDRHFAAKARRCRGDLQPDEAGAHDDDAPRRPKPLTQPPRVGEVTQHENPLKIDSRGDEGALSRAGGEHEMAIGEAPARGEFDASRASVDVRRFLAEHEIDALILIELRRPQGEAVRFHRAFQKGLGKRRPLIRQMRLRRQQRHGAYETFFA